MAETDELGHRPRLIGVGGFWSYDANAGKAYGDEITRSFLEWPEDYAINGMPIRDVLAGIDPPDRSRIAASLARSAKTSEPYREVMTISTQRGARRIFAFALARPTLYGPSAVISGWFVDITEGGIPTNFALDVSRHYLRQAQSAAQLANADLAAFLMDDADLELEKLRLGDGRG